MTALPVPTPPVPKRYTVEEYFDLEAAAVDKHEFHDGQIVAMAGGTLRHSQICLNVGGELRNRLKGKPCQAVESNTRVAAPRRHYQYPDVSVFCGPPEFDPADKRGTTLLNPTAVIEVLSESTQAYDRGAKFDRYRDVATLREYVLVSSDEPRVEVFLRQPDGTWLFSPYAGLQAVAALRSIGVDLPLSEVYDRVEFPPAPPEPAAPPAVQDKPAT